MKKCLMIYNPTSGKGFSKIMAQKYLEILKENNYEVEAIATERTGHATEIMKNAPECDVVFAIGGDGTINEVVNGNSKRKNKITICPLPGGTCNDFASMIGYSKDLEENIKLALSGEVKKIDVGTINNKSFIYVSGIGMFLNISYETKKSDKKKYGYFAYIINGIKHAFDRMKIYDAEITIDGTTYNNKYSLIMVSNSNHVAGVKNFHQEVKLDDGQMEILLFKSKNIISLALNFIAFLLRIKTKNTITLKGQKIAIKFKNYKKSIWGIDGERCVLETNTFNIETTSQMSFLIPKNNIEKLFSK